MIDRHSASPQGKDAAPPEGGDGGGGGSSFDDPEGDDSEEDGKGGSSEEECCSYEADWLRLDFLIDGPTKEQVFSLPCVSRRMKIKTRPRHCGASTAARTTTDAASRSSNSSLAR